MRCGLGTCGVVKWVATRGLVPKLGSFGGLVAGKGVERFLAMGGSPHRGFWEWISPSMDMR
jgi:hypothetical protein